METLWISLELALAVHYRQLSEHGGASGVRDFDSLEAALARPRRLAMQGGGRLDPPVLAASYAVAVVRNRPFVGGNERTAAVLCEVFLELNGWLLLAEDAEYYPMVLDIASGEASEEDLVAWLRDRARPRSVNEEWAEYGERA